MSTLLDSLLLLCLSVIILQDFKQRAIAWYLIPAVFVVLACKVFARGATGGLFSAFLFNAAFIIIQLVALTLYISIKNKKPVNIIDSYLGLGDVLFFAVLCIALSTLNFIVFFVLSLVLTLIGFTAIRLIRKPRQPEIPLAGAMALMLAVLVLAAKLWPGVDLYNDSYLLQLLQK